MEYEILCAPGLDLKKPVPFILSVSGTAQLHVNGFTQRLLSRNWAVAMCLRPKEAPLLFEGSGKPGDGPWHMHELCQHLLSEFSVSGGQFLLVGVSNGGNSVLRFSTLWPELCCGVVAVTGSLQGLCELPGTLRRLQGIPIDMYVGTKDECGFYAPMRALEADFRTIGHTPSATLTVFEDAGHVCSPLINEWLIHGKIGLMLLKAGLIGGEIFKFEVPDGFRRPSEKVIRQLLAFCKTLDLEHLTDADGCLVMQSPKGPLMSMIMPKAKTEPDEAPPATNDYAKGDIVEVWSNSRQQWDQAVVAHVSHSGESAGVQVIFEDERGKLTKTVLWEFAKQYLRKPENTCAKTASGAGTASATSSTCGATSGMSVVSGSNSWLAVGERVHVWSDSKQMWHQDGSVTKLSQTDGTVTVVFGGGSLAKTITLEQATQVLKKFAADSSRDQHTPLPVSSTGQQTIISRAQTDGPVLAPPLYSTGKSTGVTVKAAAAAPTPASASNAPAPAAPQGTPKQNLQPLNGNKILSAPAPSAAATSRTNSKAPPPPPPPPQHLVKTIITGPQGKSSGQTEASGAVHKYTVGAAVAIWSDSQKKWYEDGKVTEVSETAGITGVYGGASLMKAIPLAQAAQVLRPRF